MFPPTTLTDLPSGGRVGFEVPRTWAQLYEGVRGTEGDQDHRNQAWVISFLFIIFLRITIKSGESASQLSALLLITLTNVVVSSGMSNTFAEYPTDCFFNCCVKMFCFFFGICQIPKCVGRFSHWVLQSDFIWSLNLTEVANSPPSPLLDDLKVQLLLCQHPSSSHTCFDRELNVPGQNCILKGVHNIPESCVKPI